MPESNKTQWSDTDKAFWRIAHGDWFPLYVYWYVNSTGCMFRVPLGNIVDDVPCPPWLRELKEVTGKEAEQFIHRDFETEHEMFNYYVENRDYLGDVGWA